MNSLTTLNITVLTAFHIRLRDRYNMSALSIKLSKTEEEEQKAVKEREFVKSALKAVNEELDKRIDEVFK